jgi:hypothetical protein
MSEVIYYLFTYVNSTGIGIEKTPKAGEGRPVEPNPNEDERLKEIVSDPELSAMLLDPELQVCPIVDFTVTCFFKNFNFTQTSNN